MLSAVMLNVVMLSVVAPDIGYIIFTFTIAVIETVTVIDMNFNARLIHNI